MTENKDSIAIDDKKEYQRITVKLRGKGIVSRDIIYGKKIKTKKNKQTQNNTHSKTKRQKNKTPKHNNKLQTTTQKKLMKTTN